VSFDIHNKEELKDIVAKLKKISGIIDIERAQG
jgi:GTP pyrophosphokinase